MDTQDLPGTKEDGDGFPAPTTARTSMATEVEIRSLVEIRARASDEIWHAWVEAFGDDEMRVKLCDRENKPPVWTEGTTLHCLLEGIGGRYHSEAIVLKQSGDIVWFHMPPLSTRVDRRRSARVTGGFPVSYRGDGVDGIAVCMDVGSSGMRLRLPAELPPRTQLELYFMLPGEPLPIRLQAVIMHLLPRESAAAGVDAGLKFTTVSPSDAVKLARYCRMPVPSGAAPSIQPCVNGSSAAGPKPRAARANLAD